MIDWTFVRCLVATGLKRLPAEVDAMPLPEVWDLVRHWESWPPEHVALRALLAGPSSLAGQIIGREQAPARSPSRAGLAAELATVFGAPQNKLPPHLKTLLSVAGRRLPVVWPV
jgi:hypothetical protein